MSQDYVWNLIAKKLSGESTEEELRELEKMLRDNPDLHYPVQTIIDLWQSEVQFDQHEAHEAFNKHVERMRGMNIEFSFPEEELTVDNSRRFNRKIVFWPSLAVIIFLSALFLGSRFKGYQDPVSTSSVKESGKAFSQFSTQNGSKTNLILPDGSKVWLNAGSSLTYDSAYGKNLREVVLSGEAYFDVVKNKEKPFIIHASKINIRVLGTEFNVRSYPTDKTTEASLIRGSIEVTFKDKPDKKIILKPNEKIVVDNNRIMEDLLISSQQNRHEKIYKVPGVNIKNLTHELSTGTIIETSWVENKLIFQDESFEEIARLLERWYGVSIIFKNDQLKVDHLTGSFRNETIRQALDALKLTAPFNYEIDKNNNIIIF
jgi:transmembrane sensor